jgi:hypothetical protein
MAGFCGAVTGLPNCTASVVPFSDETQIEASFCAAIRIAKEQKSITLATRAEATYAEYRRQKASGLGANQAANAAAKGKETGANA